MNEFTGQTDLFDFIESGRKGRSVEEISSELARPFIESIHYSRKYPQNIIRSFGLYEDDELVGVCTYGIPASPSLCISLAGKENRNNVIELNRLAIKPMWGGKNESSYLIAHSLKMLPNRTFVVSYADTGWTHVGYVYQATNWLYTGMSAKITDSFSGNLHPRTASRNGQKTDLHQTRNPKHRYVYLVGNKREKKQMLKELKYPILENYPKGDEIHYDTNDPKIHIPIEIIQ